MWPAEDKRHHFVYTFALVLAAWPISPLLALFLGAVVPPVKDYWYDATYGGDVENLDVLWSWAGAVVGAAWCVAVR